MTTPIAVVFTGKSVSTILAQGGSASWRMSRYRAHLCEYVICTRNTRADWSEGPEAHGSAFMIGRVKDIIAAPSYESTSRLMFAFSEYAVFPDISKKWTGDRYPVHYTTLEDFGFSLDGLDWKPMPEPDPTGVENSERQASVEVVEDAPPADDGSPVRDIDHADRPLTLAEAKRGLALTFGVGPEAVEITIRG